MVRAAVVAMRREGGHIVDMGMRVLVVGVQFLKDCQSCRTAQTIHGCGS